MIEEIAPLTEIDTEIESRVPHKHIDQDQIQKQFAVLAYFLPHPLMPGISKKNDTYSGKADSCKVHRRKVVTQSLLDKRIDDSP